MYVKNGAFWGDPERAGTATRLFQKYSPPVERRAWKMNDLAAAWLIVPQP